jgi:hypothetical protein
MKTFGCPHPYTNCNQTMKKKLWIHYVPQKYREMIGFQILCSACNETQYLEYPEKEWTCLKCNRTSCGRCDEEDCQCLNISQELLPKGYSRVFSNGFVPLRRHRVTDKMIDQKIQNLEEHFPLVHIKCQNCKTTLHKSSACNDMFHCGRIHTCNFCQQNSFPWEKGMPLEHWQTCPRWEHDLAWFPCKDGECYNDQNECSDKNHTEAIERLHKERFVASKRSIQLK